MILDVIAVLFPSPSFTLNGVEHNTDPVDVRRLTGEHELSGDFKFRQMTDDDYLWIKQQEQSEMETVHNQQVDTLVVELIQKEYQILTGEELI